MSNGELASLSRVLAAHLREQFKPDTGSFTPRVEPSRCWTGTLHSLWHRLNMALPEWNGGKAIAGCEAINEEDAHSRLREARDQIAARFSFDTPIGKVIEIDKNRDDIGDLAPNIFAMLEWAADRLDLIIATSVGNQVLSIKNELRETHLFTWQEVLETLDLTDDNEEREEVRKLNVLYGGPIVFAKKGSQPTVERWRLLEWWQHLEATIPDRVKQVHDISARTNNTVSAGPGS